MRPVLTYTLMRVALFAAALGLVTLVGLRGFVAVLAALVVSSVASVVLLSAQRDAIGRAALARRQSREREQERQQARLREQG